MSSNPIIFQQKWIEKYVLPRQKGVYTPICQSNEVLVFQDKPKQTDV